MSHEAVSWALDEAPMLLTTAGKPDVTARFVLVAVAERADKHGMNAHPSLADIRYRTGADRSTVQRALRRLETAKLIERDGRVGGRTRWRVAMDTRRPPSDWAEIETQEDAERASTAERVRRSRATRVTGATPVTEADVKGAESATDPDVTGPAPVTSLRVLGSAPVTGVPVTHSAPVTGSDVTGVTPVRNAFNARTEPDVTGVTQPEPSKNLTTQEPSGSETPPSSESPRAGEQATIDGGQAPPPPAKKRTRDSKPKAERTVEEKEAFEAADKIAHWWWDVRCPKLGISVKNTKTFPGFRKDLVAYLTAKPPCTKQEVQQALEKLKRSWPDSGAFEAAVRGMREEASAELGMTGTDGSNVRRIGGRQAYRNPDDQSIYDQKY